MAILEAIIQYIFEFEGKDVTTHNTGSLKFTNATN